MAYPLKGGAGKSVGRTVAVGRLVASLALLIGLAGRPAAAYAGDVPPAGAPPAKPSTTATPSTATAPTATSPTTPAATPPTISPPCEAPANYIATSAPLAHLAKALSERRTLQILAVGSAAVETLGVNAGVKSYPVQVEDMLKLALKGVDVDVINRGTGGEVAQTSADRIRSEVALTKPDLVLWQLGTNDALARVDPAQFTETVKSTIDWLKENDIDVVLVGLQYTTRFARDENYFAIKHALDKIAKDENILYIKRYDAMKFIAQTRAKVHLMTSDNYHLSELGTQCMAEHVAHAMVANLFVRRFRPGGSGAPTAAPTSPSTPNPSVDSN